MHFLAFCLSHSWLQESPFTDFPDVAWTQDLNPESVHWGALVLVATYDLYHKHVSQYMVRWWLILFFFYPHSSLCGHRISVLRCVVPVCCNTSYLSHCHQIKETIKVSNTFCFSRRPLNCTFWILKSNTPGRWGVFPVVTYTGKS